MTIEPAKYITIDGREFYRAYDWTSGAFYNRGELIYVDIIISSLEGYSAYYYKGGTEVRCCANGDVGEATSVGVDTYIKNQFLFPPEVVLVEAVPSILQDAEDLYEKLYSRISWEVKDE